MKTPHLHTCSVPSCTVVVPNWRLMCVAHWSHVPYALRKEVMDARKAHEQKEISAADRAEVEQRATAAVTGIGTAVTPRYWSEGGAR